MNKPTVISAFANIVDDSHPRKVALQHYLNQYAVASNDRDARVNFISMAPQYRKRFSVPDDAIPHLMTLLNDCYMNGVSNNLFELQDMNDAGASGLVFEFCIQSEQHRIEFETVVAPFIRILFNGILTRWIAFSNAKESHYCIYQMSENPPYDGKTAKFKSTFRISIPTILLLPDVRYFIHERVWKSRDMKKLFEDRLNYRIRDCYLRSLRTAPIPLMGSSDERDIEPLIIDSIYQVNVTNGETSGDSYQVPNFVEKIKNLVHAGSIGYPCEGSLVEKGLYEPIQECTGLIEQALLDDTHLFQMAHDDAIASFIDLSVADRSLETLRDIVYMLSSKRFADEESWLEVIRCLAAESRKHYCIAVMITKDKCPKELLVWENFQEYWNEALSIPSGTMYSTNTLRYWASLDSPSHMKRYIDETIRNFIVRDIRDTMIQGRINHSNVAAYLKFMFQNNFISFSGVKNMLSWYEFVTPEASADIEPGQLYKWRNVGALPSNLSTYISNEFAEIARAVHSDLHALQTELLSGDKAKDPSTQHIVKIYKSYDRTIIQIFSGLFKRNTIEEATTIFNRNYFVKLMDAPEHILGVGNGVLEFNPRPKLIDHYHMYPISLYTDTNYVPYDENSKYVKTVYTMLRSLVPDDEADALEFLMYYFATSLDHMPKESLFLIIHGGGCHAPNTTIRMLDGTVKMVQDVEMGDKLMGDDNTARTVKELFRGTDDMVRVNLDNGDSFEVNMDHVLSLRSVAPFVADGSEVTDIKVKDFLKWDSKTRASARVYNANDKLFSFSIKKIGKGRYYGFELDGNHRYLDGDYYVHHNSNGKSVLLELCRKTLGSSYMRKLPLSFVTDQQRAKASDTNSAMMELKSARMVYYSESDRNEKVNVAQVKEITGGEALSARRLYGELENFRANCNHVVTTNHQFTIETTEHAVWRRFLSYRFKICFKLEANPEDPFERESDPDLVKKVMSDKRYQEAFLSILVHYRTILYTKYGGQILRVPHPTIVAETDEYRLKQDVFQKFISQNVYYRDGAAENLSTTVDNFRTYYKAEHAGKEYMAEKMELIHTFRNTILAKYVTRNNGEFTMDKLHSLRPGENAEPGSIRFVEWLKMKDEVDVDVEDD